ncbi:MAG TPA: FAD-dependent monooxygenase [Devosia sp.]|jgi:2-polyprenyl-6-methoxyphenol hydroxylase-like FAD-dependent oxidoreductase|uniref:FAD-dependent monooxygenase n=1 Tax=Devosia sp. TaxID=1871048 RepID=UPI002DDD77CE|nr:FAD-dependent monooxygenase [Devosia sp.]HEV2513749.1 FAD-dependent monooxygenase [Devosia sp.]
MRRSEHQVLIAGGGPTGLMLAGELALAGIDAAVVERRQSREVVGARAGGLHPRTLEIFDQRGIGERFLAEGQVAQAVGFAGVRLDLSGFPTRHPYTLGLWQNHIERILGGWVDELDVTVYRGTEVIGFTQTDAGVDVALGDGETMRAQYLVGCDGGRSLVRKAAGIEFPGSEPTTSNLIAEAEMAEEPPELGIRRDATGIHSIGRAEYEIRDGQIIFAKSGPVRVLVTEREVGKSGEPTLDEVKEVLIGVYGTDYGIHSPTSITRFTDAARQAAAYRHGRVLVAGDAAHIHPPDGGMGLQTGVQDAVNLGWKLAQVIKGNAPESLLDSYHDERHPVGAKVLRYTMAAVALRREDDRTKALRQTMADLLELDEPRRHVAADLTGLGIHYDLGEGHPLLGRRMPDLDIETASGRQRVSDLLHAARPVLLNLAAPGTLKLAPWADRVEVVDATSAGPWALPAMGSVTAPAALLIRPDGYVAWVGDESGQGLAEALAMWFGPGTPHG